MEGDVLIVLENIFKNPAILMNLPELEELIWFSRIQKTHV